MEFFIKIFKALSDPNRVRILKMLELRPLCVCELPGLLKIATSTVSKHLSILRDSGMITDRKAGKWVIYRLNTDSSNLQVRQLLSLLPTWLNNDDIIKENLIKISKMENSNCNI